MGLMLSCDRLEFQAGSFEFNEDILQGTEDNPSSLQAPQRSHFVHVTPTQRIDPSKIPLWFIDDLNFNGMDKAISYQLKRFQQLYLSGTIQFGEDVYPRAILPFALRKFQVLYHAYKDCLRNQNMNQCRYAFHQVLINQFHVYEPKSSINRSHPAHFTAYYHPTLLASKIRTNRFRYAVYAKPQVAHLRTLSRCQIDIQGRLLGHGYELFYTDNLYNIYNLHIQGGGQTAFVDGSRNFYLHFDGSNQKRTRFFSKQRFLAASPKRQAEMICSSPNYVYFKPSLRAAIGSDDVSLTDHRSIATDSRYYRQKGILAFVQAKRPSYNIWRETGRIRIQNFSRFVLDQDTGSAIRGKARVDLFFGYSQYASVAAYHVNNYGRLFFLMPKGP